MSYFDATDTLRKQLDERGVEWKPIDGEHIRFTEWCTHGGAFVYTARESFRSYGDHMLRVETCGLPKACLIATPDQVIAATLGNGMLTADDVLNAVYNHGARWQAIADELNAALGGGECENVGDQPVVIAMEHIADLKQLVRDLYDVAARGGFDVGEESKFSERMANLDEMRGEA